MSWVAMMLAAVDRADEILVIELNEWLESVAPRRGTGGGRGVGSLIRVRSWGGWKAPECCVYAGVLNLADIDAIVAKFSEMPWEYPECAQLLLQDQEDLFFSLWMFYDGGLRRVTRSPASVERDVSPIEDSAVRLRRARDDDDEFLSRLLSSTAHSPVPPRSRLSGIVALALEPGSPGPSLEETWLRAGGGWAWPLPPGAGQSRPGTGIFLAAVPGPGDRDAEGALLAGLVRMARENGAGLVLAYATAGSRVAELFTKHGFTEARELSGPQTTVFRLDTS